MKNNQIIKFAVLNALGTYIYISFVGWFMFTISKFFNGKDNNQNFWPIVIFLLVFVLSAAVTGSLVLGKPIFLWFSDQKKEAVKLLIYTIGIIFLLTLLTALFLMLK